MNPDNTEEIKVTVDTLADEKVEVKDKAQEELVYRPAPRGAKSSGARSPSVRYVRREMMLPLYFSVGSNCVLVDDDQLEGYPTFTNIEESAPRALLAAKSEDIDVITGGADAALRPVPDFQSDYQSNDDEDGVYGPAQRRTISRRIRPANYISFDVRRRHAPAGHATSCGQRTDCLRVASVLGLQRQPYRRQPCVGRT